MTLVLAVAGLLAVVGLYYGVRIWRVFSGSDKSFDERLARNGLAEYNARVVRETAEGKRPLQELSVARLMCEILEAASAAPAGPGQAAVVVPPDEGYRFACEELVKLGRLTPTPDGSGYLPK